MKTIIKLGVCASVIFMYYADQPALSQSVTPPVVVAQKKATPEEIEKLKKAVEAHPDSLSAHNAYINSMVTGLYFEPELVAQYKKWMEKYPRNINFPFAIGEAFLKRELPQAKEYLLKVVQMDPKNAKAWIGLSEDADRSGQADLAKQYIHKASISDPSNAQYAIYDLHSTEEGDPAAYRQKVLDFTKRFPDSERGAQALSSLATRSIDNDDKIKNLEKLRELYPPSKFQWTASAMYELWAIYIQTDPAKALTLANEVGAVSKYFWKEIAAFTQNIIQERKLMGDQKYSDAAALLAQTKLPGFPNVGDFYYPEQAAVLDKAGQTKTAYDDLITIFAKKPTDKLLAAMELYGGKIGKDKAQVQADIQALRKSSSIPAPPFNLGLYTSDGKLSLADLKGKVVLITYWFPGCGPCRGEFPHFQAVMNGYKDNPKVAFIGINVVPQQDQYVLPFMRNTKYSFVPLRGTEENTKDYGVRGEPTNFLIDQNGNIVFKGFTITENNQRTLELMINSLL